MISICANGAFIRIEDISAPFTLIGQRKTRLIDAPNGQSKMASGSEVPS
jgi:hypothetical protein